MLVTLEYWVQTNERNLLRHMKWYTLYIYIYIHIYDIYIYIFIYMYINVYWKKPIATHEMIYITHIYIHIYDMYTYIFIYMYIYVYWYICSKFYVSPHIYIYVDICVLLVTLEYCAYIKEKTYCNTWKDIYIWYNIYDLYIYIYIYITIYL